MESDTLTVALVAAIVPLALAALSRGALASASPGELRYSRVFRWFSLLMTVAPPLGLLAILIFVQKKPLQGDERVAFISVLLFFPAMAIPLVLEFFRVRHQYDDAGFTFRSPWSKHRSIAWTDISSLTWRKSVKWLDIRTNAGVTLHLSPWLSGLKPFANLALARIPSVALLAHPEGRAVLQVMSAGTAGQLMTSPLPPEKLLASTTTRTG